MTFEPTDRRATSTARRHENRRIYASRHRSHQLPSNPHAQFFSWRNPPAAKLSNQYAGNEEILPSTDNPLMGSELATGIQSSSGGAQLVGLALLYKLCPATAGFKAGVKRDSQSACNISTIRKNHVRYFNL